jgi:AraC-like DNA-binding protein
MAGTTNSGVQEIAWSAAGGKQPAGRDVLSFAARNVHTVRKDSFSLRGVSEAVARAYSIDGFTLVYSESSGPAMLAQVEERDRSSIAEDHIDRVCLFAQVIGERSIEQGGRTQVCGAGHAAVYMTSFPYKAVTTPHDNRIEMAALYVPRKFVQRKIGRPLRDAVLDPSSDARTFASDSLRLFATHAWKLEPCDFLRMAQVVSDMFLEIYCNVGSASAQGAPVRAVTRARLKEIIDTNLCDPELTIGKISSLSGLSSNYIHKLFGEIGETPWSYIKGQRLKNALDILRSPSHEDVSITDVAFSLGFSDSSYFSRAFKQAFGLTPRQARSLS